MSLCDFNKPKRPYLVSWTQKTRTRFRGWEERERLGDYSSSRKTCVILATSDRAAIKLAEKEFGSSKDDLWRPTMFAKDFKANERKQRKFHW